MNIKKIIRLLLREELVWNYWMRRPKDDMGIGDVSQSIDVQRKLVHDSFADDFEQHGNELMHALEVASDIRSLENELTSRHIDVYELVPDAIEFDRCVEHDDVEGVRAQLIGAVQSWIDDELAPNDDDDTTGLTAHPMRKIPGASPSLKRSMGY